MSPNMAAVPTNSTNTYSNVNKQMKHAYIGKGYVIYNNYFTVCYKLPGPHCGQTQLNYSEWNSSRAFQKVQLYLCFLVSIQSLPAASSCYASVIHNTALALVVTEPYSIYHRSLAAVVSERNTEAELQDISIQSVAFFTWLHTSRVVLCVSATAAVIGRSTCIT